MTKREFRENIYITLFQVPFYPAEAAQEQADLFLEDLEDVPEKDKVRLRENFFQILPHLSELDEKISGKAKGWKLERLGKADLAILRLAVFEILYNEKVPNAVAINEAVELAKKYGGDKSGKFINGVLGAIERETQEEEKSEE